jgi:chromosome segregation ATPase
MKKLTLAVLFATAIGLCQTPVKESDTLQSLLAEVRQLRQDIETMTVASQRVQIALYGLQIQDAAVTRAAQRLDAARTRRSGAESNRQHWAGEIQRLEASLISGTLPEAQTKEIQSALIQAKSQLDVQATEVQTLQAAESEASSQLQNDQAKLAEQQDRIERLDKTLEKLGGDGK